METPAEAYHRLTSYSADRHWLEPVDDDRVRQDFIPLLPEAEPPPFKDYPSGLRRVALPEVPAAGAGAARLLSGTGTAGPGPGRAPTVGDLSAILARCAGRKRRSPRFRAVSSAGNRHPYEVYVCARDVRGLPDGVWHYDARVHALTLVGPPPIGGATALVVAGVPWRSCWRYGERGYRHVGWDCGTVASHAVLAASAQGLSARLETAFDDAAVGSLIGARDREEVPMVVVPLVDAAPAVTPSRPATPGDLGGGAEDFPLVVAVHEAGNLDGAAAVAGWRRHGVPGEPLREPDGAGGDAFDAVVDRRTSARRLDGTAAISAAAARWLLGVASAPPPWDAGRLHEVTAVVHAVDGMAAGVHRPAADGPLWTQPGSRDATCRACLDQAAGRDAALVVFVTPSPGPGIASQARAYRAALLAGGYALGRTYLAATVLGLGCCGLGFLDSALPGTIGSADALAAAAVGVRP
jgi:nitroreductase